MGIQEVGNLLRRIREAHGLTTEQAAAMVGVDISQWSRWETGAAVIPLHRAARIAAIWHRPEVAFAANRDTRTVAEDYRRAAA